MSWHGGILEGCLCIGEVKENGYNDAISEWLLKLELALEQELKAKEEYNNKDSKRKECKAKMAKFSETIARLVPDLISKSKPNYHYSSNSAKEALNSTPSLAETPIMPSHQVTDDRRTDPRGLVGLMLHQEL